MFDLVAATAALAHAAGAVVVHANVGHVWALVHSTLGLLHALVNTLQHGFDQDVLLGVAFPGVAHLEEQYIDVHFSLLFKPNLATVQRWLVDLE